MDSGRCFCSGLPAGHRWLLAEGYLWSSMVRIWPSMVLSVVSAYEMSAARPSKSLQGFMEPVGVKPTALRSIFIKLLL